jgi:hypothetical protein
VALGVLLFAINVFAHLRPTGQGGHIDAPR